MEFQFQDAKQGFASPDFLYNFAPAGDLAPKYNAPPAPNSVENLAVDFIQKQKQVADAVAQQHRIDSIYERVMNEAPRRDVEVLPPEDPAEVFNPNKTRMRNITPVEQQQEISDLLERQVKRPRTPSVAEPPATPSYKSIPLTDPMVTPPSYTPRQRVGGTNPAPNAKPSGLPFPAGRLAAPLVGGAIDFGFRVVAGQPPAQAAVGAVGSTVGSLVGGALGSAVGPVGTFVGGVIGGFVGGAIADFLFQQAQPNPAEIPQNFEYSKSPFSGGQTPGVLYQILYGVPRAGSTPFRSLTIPLVGKITDIKYSPNGQGNWRIEFYYDNGNQVTVNEGVGKVQDGPPFVEAIFRPDGQADTGGDPPGIAPSPDNRSPESINHPGNSEYSVPRPFPGASQSKAPTNYVPGSVSPKASPRGDTPGWIPHGGLSPKINPNPTTTPGNLGGNFPSPSPNPSPSPSPGGSPSPSPGGSPSPSPLPNPPGYRLDSPGGKPSGSPSGSPGTLAPPKSTPSGLPNLAPQTPPADGFKAVPQPEPQPQPQQPTSPQTDICESPCIQSMGQKINESSIFWVDLQVPVVSCSQDENGLWMPKRENQAVKVIATSSGNEVAKTQAQFEELAKANEELCSQKNSSDAYLVTPEWWQVRSFQRPQLVIQYAELLTNNKLGRSRWAVTVPHYNKPKDYKPKFPQYEKGNFEGILVLKDNSKIIINAKNKTECVRVLESFKTFVDPDYLKDIKPPKIGERPGVYKEVVVVPVYAHFFQDGQKDNVPTWSIKLRDKK